MMGAGLGAGMMGAGMGAGMMGAGMGAGMMGSGMGAVMGAGLVKGADLFGDLEMILFL
jgi:hypothetical protein